MSRPHSPPLPKHCELCGPSKELKSETLHLHARCHWHAPLHAILVGNRLTLQCYQCQRHVAEYFILKDDDVSLRKVKRQLLMKRKIIDQIIDDQLGEEEDR